MILSRALNVCCLSIVLIGCGGSSDNSTSEQSTQQTIYSLNDIPVISALENSQQSVTISWRGDNDVTATVEQVSGPTVDLIKDGSLITLTLPEVTEDETAVLLVKLLKGEQTQDSTEVTVNIANDASGLYASDYSGLLIDDLAVAETDEWRLSQIGLYRYLVEQFEARESCYPSPTDCNFFTSFALMIGDNVRGDFNNDGLQDVAVSITYSPHRVERNLDIYPGTVFIFTGDEENGLVLNNDVIIDHNLIKRHQPYRMAVADLNQDGADDLIVSGGAIPASLEEQKQGNLFIAEDLPIILLSTGTGRLYDATPDADISAGEGTSVFGHNLAIGDVNNDGYIDIYTGMSMILNNGDGTFTEHSDRYFSSAAQWSTPLASAMGDMNDDGRTDLAILDYTTLDGVAIAL